MGAVVQAKTLRVVLAGLTLVVTSVIVYALASSASLIFSSHGHVSLDPFRQLFHDTELPQVLRDTTVFVVGVTGLSVIFGTFLAWVSERTDASIGWASRLLPTVPVLMPVLGGAIGWLLLMAPRAGLLTHYLRLPGWVNAYTMFGIILISAIYVAPFVFLVVSASFRSADPALEEASRIAGRGPLSTLFRVTIPNAVPALVGGTTFAVMLSVALLATPLIFGPQAHIFLLSEYVFQKTLVTSPPNYGVAVAISIFPLLLIATLVIVQARVSRSKRHVGAPGRARGAVVRTGALRWPLRAIVVLYLVVSTALPAAGLLLVSLQPYWSSTVQMSLFSFDNYRALWSNPLITHSVINSFEIAAISAAILMFSAVLVVYWLRLPRRNPVAAGVRALLRIILALPSVVPTLILALAFLITFNREPIVLYGHKSLIVLAFVVIHFTQAMQSAEAAFSRVNDDLLNAARLSGSSEVKTLRQIVFPLVLPPTVEGSLFILALMLSEFAAAVFLATPSIPLIGPTLYNLFSTGAIPPVAALALAVTVANIVLVIFARVVVRRVFQRRRPVTGPTSTSVAVPLAQPLA